MNKFSDDLFSDLMREHGSTLMEVRREDPQVRRVGRSLWMTSGVLTATGAAALGFVALGGGSGAAYAVTDTNGVVTVSVTNLSGIAGANAKLASLGVPVAAASVNSDCTSISSLPLVQVPNVTGTAKENADGSVSVDVRGVPAGDTAVAAFEKESNGDLRGAVAVIKGKAPGCVSLPPAPSQGSGNGQANSGASGAAGSSVHSGGGGS